MCMPGHGTEMLSEPDFSSMRTEGVLLVEIEGQPEIRSYTLPGASGRALNPPRGTVLTVVDEAGSLYYFDALPKPGWTHRTGVCPPASRCPPRCLP